MLLEGTWSVDTIRIEYQWEQNRYDGGDLSKILGLCYTVKWEAKQEFFQTIPKTTIILKSFYQPYSHKI